MDILPIELLSHIFSFLTPNEILNFQYVNRTFYGASLHLPITDHHYPDAATLQQALPALLSPLYHLPRQLTSTLFLTVGSPRRTGTVGSYHLQIHIHAAMGDHVTVLTVRTRSYSILPASTTLRSLILHAKPGYHLCKLAAGKYITIDDMYLLPEPRGHTGQYGHVLLSAMTGAGAVRITGEALAAGGMVMVGEHGGSLCPRFYQTVRRGGDWEGIVEVRFEDRVFFDKIQAREVLGWLTEWSMDSAEGFGYVCGLVKEAKRCADMVSERFG